MARSFHPEFQPIYVDPFTDEGFKIIFGTPGKSEEILRGFLNELMKGDTQFGNIKTISFRPTVRNRQRKGGKTIIYDVLCETESNNRYIVEMQQEKNANFLNRAIYYIAKAIEEQGYVKKGEPEWKYSPLYPVIGVFLCDFFVEGLTRKLVTRCGNMDLDTKKPVGNHFRQYFVQMPDFNKTPAECVSKFDQWIFILKNMPTLQIIPFDIEHDRALSQLDEVSRVAALKDTKRRKYEAALRDKRDRLAALDTAIQEGLKQGMAKGMAKGIEKGRAEGELEKSIEVAKTAIGMGFDDAATQKLSGLPIEEIQKLR